MRRNAILLHIGTIEQISGCMFNHNKSAYDSVSYKLFEVELKD